MIESLSPTPVEWLLLFCVVALLLMDVAQMILLARVDSQLTKFGRLLRKARNWIKEQDEEDTLPPSTPLS